MQKITPFLWFDDKDEEAVNFYFSIFRNSKIVGVARYGPLSTRYDPSKSEWDPSGNSGIDTSTGESSEPRIPFAR